MDKEIKAPNGRIISFADFGEDNKIPAFYCHGGPGSRNAVKGSSEKDKDNLIRYIGVDRPGYGNTSPMPGRTINDWTDDLILIAEYLNIDNFYIIGVSTGGSYSLATAARFSDQVLGVLLCCAMSDMRWASKNATMEGVEQFVGLSREEAYQLAVKDMGEDGSKMLSNNGLSPADILYLQKPENIERFVNDDATFAQGVTGYADDRLADCSAQGWSSFDINNVICPVSIIHGEVDTIVPVAHAQHTAEIVKDAHLNIYPDHGHLSISDEINENLQALIKRSQY
tara:strand:+ start:3455 stop:4303 length:849 start_codon:yes stop_codon:yes gene_type:complete